MNITASADDLANKFTQQGPRGPIFRDLKRLKRIAFFCKHRSRDQDTRRTYIIDGFEDSALNYKFELRRPNNEGGFSSTEISIKDYFEKQYNIRLRFPKLPLIKTRKGEVFPMELCFIVEVYLSPIPNLFRKLVLTKAKGQRYPFKLDDRQTSDMIKFTVQRPSIRAGQIAQNVAKLDWKKDPLLIQYGMEISTRMIQVRLFCVS
jgi:eukaryotic translation initiation factor 2C